MHVEIFTKTDWATFWATFSKTHLVTQFGTQELLSAGGVRGLLAELLFSLLF
jgi:hypothetical protein